MGKLCSKLYTDTQYNHIFNVSIYSPLTWLLQDYLNEKAEYLNDYMVIFTKVKGSVKFLVKEVIKQKATLTYIHSL